MEIWQAIVLGFVQGFTEFLPVSSSGHLILMEHWFGINEGAIFYSVMLHIGTLIPVIVVLWKQIIGLFKKPFSKLLYLILATIPAGVVGLIIHFTVDLDALFAEKIWLIGITFLLTAGELLFTEIFSKKKELACGIGIKQSLFMGAGQALGVVPGLSRSGTTITFGTLAKTEKSENASFTFLMSIPIIVAAALLEGYQVVKGGVGSIAVLPLLLGMLTSAICGYVAIKFMFAVIKKANYKWFSLYLVLISTATFITYAVGV
ncbi:MAG: undecaprenyl-diphosphate phosphatase [Clostridia bacterium]|nr:undecaprenyl-diphosphate phosphatase [Clostridia bacterium]